MDRKKLIFNILLYLSFLFLIFFLYKFDYFTVQLSDFNIIYLILSIVFLWSGFLLSALSWQIILRKHNIVISYKQALVSHGLSIFAKYIPGKIWVVLGRASKISVNHHSIKLTSFVSLKEQIIFVWTGLLLSIFPLIINRGIDLYSVSILLLFGLISFMIFSDKFRQIVIWGIKKIIKKEIDIPHVSIRDHISTIIYVTFYWSAWIFSFYFFAISIYSSTTFLIGFMFPLSVTLGLLAIIAPGGIGVREAVLTGFMVLKGIPLEIATSISVLSRLWFMSGEIFVFITGFIVSRGKKMRNSRS